jgi:hypothetical protein
MKKITLLLTLFLVSCSGKQETTLSYKIPKDKTFTYTFVMESKKLTITQEVDFKLIDTTENVLKIETEIKKMIWEDGSEYEEDTNEYYKNNFINRPLVFTMNSQGKIIKKLSYKNGNQEEVPVFDANNFFIELPNDIKKTGASWTRKRPIKDMMFNEVATTYTLKKIEKDTLAHINVSSELLGDDSKGFTKFFNGVYIVNTKNGILEKGALKITGFSGFSNISADLSIEKIH